MSKTWEQENNEAIYKTSLKFLKESTKDDPFYGLELYITPNCNQSCEYCLSPIWEDKDKKKNGRCINCKTYFTPEQYTYRNEC